MTSREIVVKTFEFKNPERIALNLPTVGITDFYYLPFLPEKDWKPSVQTAEEWEDEWGSTWRRVGSDKTTMGQPTKPFIDNWDKLKKIRVPDLGEYRFELANFIVGSKIVADKFKMGSGGLRLFERMHFLRGFSELLGDLAAGMEECEILADLITDYNVTLIERWGKAGADGIIDCDDWGCENRLLISPNAWRKFFKPKYARMIKKAKEYNMKTILHSCGYIVDILDDLIEIGLDGIDMDQQDNMGLENLSKRFGGRITFECPIDIQRMAALNDKEIEEEAKKRVRLLGSFGGGLIAKEYSAPDAIGVRREQNLAMDIAFIKFGVLKKVF